MEKITCEVPKNFNLFLFGDDHFGNPFRHKKGWQKLVRMMNNEFEGCSYSIGVDHGDLCEAITLNDARADNTMPFESMEGVCDWQIDGAIEARELIKSKLVCILEGNHPLKLFRYSKMTERVCKGLKVPYGEWSAKITYVTKKGEVLFKHFATHGYRNINSTCDDPKRRITNMELILKRLLRRKFGDVLLCSMGHTHKLLICRPEEELWLSDDGHEITQHYSTSDDVSGMSNIHADHKWYVNTGSFLKLFDPKIKGSPYQERFGYDPTEIGFCVALCRNGNIKDIKKITV